MKMRRWAALSGLIGSAAILAASVGGVAANAAGQAPLQKANTIVTALPLQVGITDYAPIANASAYTVYNSAIEYMMWAPVVMVSGSDTIDWADSLASKITANANDTQFTVTLKNWKWSNGKMITGDDVAWTTNVLLAGCTMSNPPYMYGGCGFGGLPPSSAHGVLKSARALGPHQVLFTLSKSVNPVYFELNGLGQIQPMPKALWNRGSYKATLALLAKIYNKPTASQYKVVSGPFKFKSAINDESYTFVPNTAYSGHQAHYTWVEQYEASDSAEFAALRKNQINAGYLTTSMYGSANQLKGQFKQSLSQGFCWYGIELNSAKNSLAVGASFQDQKVRAALEFGIDQNAIGKVLDGTLNGKNLWVPNYSAIPEGFASLTKAVFGVSSIPNAYPYNPARGKALLEKDGWALDAQGVMEKNGVSLKFPVFYDSGSIETANAAVILQQDWAKMGVKITPQPVAFDTLVGMSDAQGAANKWAVNWTGGWCYEPNFYPTGGGMWGYYDSQDDYNYAPFNKSVADSYLPGTPAQAQQRMYQYAEATAKDLPFLWQPGGYGVNEIAPYIHGMNKYYNPVQAFTMMNWISISH